MTEFVTEPGRGVKGVVSGRRVLVGTAAWLETQGIDVAPVRDRPQRWRATGGPRCSLPKTMRWSGVVGIADPLRPEARAVVGTLVQMELNVVMLTGDRQATAAAIAAEAGVVNVVAEVLPQEKVDAVRSRQARGEVVAMVGDGVNDAPALAQADVGIAMGGGTDIALDAADVALMRGDLRTLVSAIHVSRAAMKTMRQNLFWAFVYNCIGIPVAAGALYPAFGILLSPILASAAMAFSSVSVVSNSLRLRRAAV